MTSIEAIIDRQLKRWEFQKHMAAREAAENHRARPIITISRTLGSRGDEIASRLAELTGFHLMDKEILDAIASDFGTQTRMIELLDENTRSELESWFDGIIRGRIIDSSDYLKALAKTVGSIMRHGEAILIGRGANIIVGPQRGFHIRVVAPIESRVKKIAAEKNISAEEARKMIDEVESTKTKFIRKSFDRNIDDPSIYDLVINSDSLDLEDAAELALLAYGRKERVLSR